MKSKNIPLKIVQAIKKINKPFVFDEKGIHLKNQLVFGNRFKLESVHISAEVKDLFLNSQMVFGSTTGEIKDDKDLGSTFVLAATENEGTSFFITLKKNS
jgi:hypothetical protein